MIEEYSFLMSDISFPIYLVQELQDVAEKILQNESNKIILIYDNALDSHLIDKLSEFIEEKIPCLKIGVSINERTKNLDMVKSIIESILELKATRRTVIVAIGGGVLGNVVGMVAGLAFRGIPLIHIPTTIVAATDSILSIKQAVNTKYGKNLVGIYYCQNSVIITNAFFSTLPKREYYAGLAETIKNLLAIIPDEIPTFKGKILKFHYSYEDLKYIFEISLRAKQKVLINDKYEKNTGLVLEYGHTVGHAIELITGGMVRHGEAVAFGMLVMAEISRELGFLNDSEVEMHYKLLDMIDMYGMFDLIKNCPTCKIIQVMRYDNKRACIKKPNTIKLVLLRRLGECCSDDYSNLLEIDTRLIAEKIDFVKKKSV